jgi:large subunit ribosomal protein L3
MTAAILGKKLGMTSLYNEEGTHIPCTVILAGPCPIVQIKTKDNDGYSAVQIGFDEVPERKVNKPKLGHLNKAGVKPVRILKEFRDPKNDYEIGNELNVNQFQKGDKVRISGTGKGRGFQGVMKRHNFSGVGMATHGQSDRQRHPGSVGQSSYPSRIIKGVRMAGRMGGKRVTVRNIEIVEIIADQNLILIKGSLPGAINSLLEIVKQ